MTGTDMEQLALHSEYYFGDCRRSGIRLYTSVHIQNIEVTGKIIIRGWIDVKRIPTCIVLRGYAPNEHLFRSTSYNFQMCAPRISYCHSKRQFRYYYYEWYIPSNYKGGMDWDILFYGPPSLVWQ
ncbi:uncharacterized protein LOC106129258 [Amyelois transitella]|uniref:uncharacterized protein LOC106129258 n=1 Tax=Amyelois transitella TaxID=680683 RepID=UPI00067C4A75|nr:uncharacterized protein LOC106129258 [Amyelois transitella]